VLRLNNVLGWLNLVSEEMSCVVLDDSHAALLDEKLAFT
jgi:hypothetical protein